MRGMMLQQILFIASTTTNDAITNWVESLSVPWLNEELIGMEYWRWAAVITVIAIGFAIDLIVRTILRSVLRSITHSDSRDQELVFHQ